MNRAVATIERGRGGRVVVREGEEMGEEREEVC